MYIEAKKIAKQLNATRHAVQQSDPPSCAFFLPKSHQQHQKPT